MGGMKPGMMMVMGKISQYERQPRSEYGGSPERRMIGYDRDYNTENRRRMGNERVDYGGMRYEPPESRFAHDEWGRFMEREGWENNRGYPMYGYEPEARRRRDERGRFMMNDGEYSPHMMGGAYPQMRDGSRYGFGDVYANIDATGAMNRPGMMGGASHMDRPVDEYTARMWVNKMDGGEHFKAEQAEQLRGAICPDCHMWEFYTALNAMYSDYCETAKKMGIDKPEFYAHLAKDFLHDKDAGPHKLRKYMETIPK